MCYASFIDIPISVHTSNTVGPLLSQFPSQPPYRNGPSELLTPLSESFSGLPTAWRTKFSSVFRNANYLLTLYSEHWASARSPISQGLCISLALCPKCLFPSCTIFKTMVQSPPLWSLPISSPPECATRSILYQCLPPAPAVSWNTTGCVDLLTFCVPTELGTLEGRGNVLLITVSQCLAIDWRRGFTPKKFVEPNGWTAYRRTSRLLAV